MSSLHPDRLSTEGAAPAPGTTSTRSAQRRGTLTDRQTGDAAPAKRGGRHAAPRATRSFRRSAAATAPAAPAGAGPGAATPGAGTRRAISHKAATGKAAATATVATEAAKASSAKPTTAKASSAKPAASRPTSPPQRPAEVALPADDGPALEENALPGDATPVLAHLLGRPAAAVRRRPSLYLAAALATVVGVGGGLSSAGPAAMADTATVPTSVSVADQLDLPADAAAPVVDAETTDRLGELVAGRAERDAEQTEAVRVQVRADRAAAEAERRAAVAAAEAARPEAVLPVPGGQLTSGFGARWGTLHAGIDLAAPMRTPEYAVMDGIVLEAGPASGFGLAVYVQHESGDVTVYGHMDEILVSAGQVVQAGDTIALLGNTGQSTGPHLHLEVHQGGLDGTKIDPVPWLRELGLDI